MNNIKKIIMSALFLTMCASVFGQKYFTKDGHVTFHSDAPMEKIEAHNKRTTAVLDTETGAIEFALLIKSFQFEKALMQEHFNENYMESDKFPKAVFKGQIVNRDEVDFDSDGSYQADVKGQMTIHGVTKEVVAAGMFNVKNGEISADAVFVVKCEDYDIKIPNVVAENIAKEISVKVNIELEPLDQ